MCKLTSRRSAASMLRQRGFTLLEMSVAATLGAMLTVGALLTVQFNDRLTEGRIVGEHMLRLSNAVVRYKDCLLYTSPSPRDS